MHNTADYEAWLRSPFGQVHAQAEASAEARPLAEAQAVIEHFDKHPELAEGISVASRCSLGWWDRERCGSVHDIVEEGFKRAFAVHMAAWQDWLYIIKHSPDYEFKNNRWRKRRPKKMRRIA